jgi:hypothetical protein
MHQIFGAGVKIIFTPPLLYVVDDQICYTSIVVKILFGWILNIFSFKLLTSRIDKY